MRPVRLREYFAHGVRGVHRIAAPFAERDTHDLLYGQADAGDWLAVPPNVQPVDVPLDPALVIAHRFGKLAEA